ncbi:MAG TPA: porin [Chitinophagaceae bacterium]|nr:porin [Chitinophagaceae bacterium]MCC6634690.1 porin [Chitinophagaceae bacterium]HMZ46742.1 porin [Chitinophagaceae bacterium]HNE92790.1 porin [Chitinophagaceae bacterium]HNF29762.1 porin [Chitinophagaceae bacterium]
MRKHLIKSLVFVIGLLYCTISNAQFLMDMVDTTKETGKGLLNIYKKFDHLKISCYIQPQFQIAQSKGIPTFEGPDFNEEVNNRFLLRRSRLRFDYVHFEENNTPGVQIAFQFDANERGFTLRDVWGRVFENKYKLFSFTTGMFARPFGYETNLSSSVRESPERGRMNQLLMKSERDLGAMISLDARKKISGLQYLKVDLGLFNGQGINAKGDFDNSKDVVARVALKPYKISKNITVSMGASALMGGLLQNTKYVYYTSLENGIKKILVDSAIDNKGKNAPRKYIGTDVQLKIKNRIGFTELRAEFIAGKHAVLENSNTTPTSLVTDKNGYYIRNFNGAYFYFIQNIFSQKHQLVVKYDWFDPNSRTSKKDIGKVGSNFNSADIKYNTLGLGYINHVSNNIKLTLYYAKVWNEKTQLTGYTKDVKDDVFTCRLQFWF